MLYEKDFPFLAEKGHVISLVGGGGKTTLLYAMAAHCAHKGWKVLVTTTTHIQQPAATQWTRDDAVLSALWQSGRYAVAGTPAAEGKLTGLPTAQLSRWMAQADIVLVEADGAKHFPCKAPAAHEPVLLPQSDIVLAVAGLSALGKPLQTVCFRLEQTCHVLDAAPETFLTPERLARLLADAQGGRKLVGDRQFYAVLNQADTPALQRLGRETQQYLQHYGVSSVLTCFEEGERA